jgi:arylsulfatase A-like enzyme
MSVPFKVVINLDVRDSVQDWEPYLAPRAPAGAPNVLYIVWDDTGIAAWDTFGGLIETPNMTRIGDRGLRYTNWHTTALCSPTRSSLLTGRNAHANGMACIV